MFTDVKQYKEALSLMDAEDLDQDLKSELVDAIRYFETDHPDVAKRAVAELTGDEEAIATQRQLGAVPQSGRIGRSSLESYRKSALVPRSRDEYFEQSAKLRASKKQPIDPGYYDIDTEEQAAIQSGLEEAYDAGGAGPLPATMSPYPEERAEALAEANIQANEESGDDGTGELVRQNEEAYQNDLVKGGLAHINTELPTASKRTDLSAPPEYLPEGATIAELLHTQPWLEPSLDVVKELFRSQGHNVDGMTKEDPRYLRFSDAAWKKAYLEAKAAGKPLVRLDYMGRDDWKRQAYKAQAIALNEVAGPLIYGSDKSFSAGLVTEALTGMLGEDARKAAHAVTERSPVVAGAGQVVGAFAPGGLAARVYGAAARRLAPAGVQGGVGLAQRLVGGTAAAGVTGATESVASDLVRNAGEAVFSDAPNMRSAGDILARGVTSGAVSLPFGLAGAGGSELAGKAVTVLREGPRAKAISDLEQAGMSTGQSYLLGRMFGKPKMLKKLEAKRAESQRPFLEDVIADDVVDGLSAAERKRAGRESTLTSASEEGASKQDILAFRKKPGQEARDEALFSRAEDAGVAEELLMLPASRALQEITKATKLRSFIGLPLWPGLEGIALRADPLMRALSRRESAHSAVPDARAAEITEDLLNFIRNIASKGVGKSPERVPFVKGELLTSGPMNPIKDIAQGRAGRLSARQIGAGASGVESGRRERYTISDLTWEEQQVLKQLIEAMQRAGQLPVASGE